LDIELEGVPAHLWGVGTAELLLDGLCMVQGLHPDSIDSMDMAVLKLRAWCFSTDSLPAVLDLHVQEPLVVGEDGSIVPRTLVYPISVRVITPGDWPAGDMSVVLPPVVEDDDDRDQFQQRRRIIGHDLSAWPLVHSRLGPRTSSSSAAEPVEDALPPVVLADELAVSGSVDAEFFPCASVEELLAPGPAGPVDATILPNDLDGSVVPFILGAAVVELTAPGSADPVDAEILPSALAAVDSNLCAADIQVASSSFINLLGRPRPSLNCWLSTKPRCFKVYFRRKKTLVVEESVISPQLLGFRNDLVLPTTQLLPTPPLIAKRRKTIPSNFKPRRSRRVAKFPPEAMFG
jgi:hypothetical protein